LRHTASARLLICGFALALSAAACGLSGPEPVDGHLARPLHSTAVCERVAAAATRAVQAVDGVTGDHDADQLVAVHARDRVGVARFRIRRSLRPAVTDVYDSLDRLQSAWLEDSDAAVNQAVTTVARQTSALERRCGTQSQPPVQLPAGAHKIKHVIVIMQENRSFDHYFGTFPGADGIPMKDGVPTVCLPNPAIDGCSSPEHHSIAEFDHGGPHTYDDSLADINDGKMNNFIRQWEGTRVYCHEPGNEVKPTCVYESQHPDVMAYHDGGDIPNYWEYAQRFVLQDHMFEPDLGWSQPAHLAMVSGWSAVCKDPYLAVTCQESITFNDVDNAWPHAPSYGWTDITYLLHKYGVSWRYYIATGSLNDCEGTTDEEITCSAGTKAIGTPEPWNPLPDFTDVRNSHQVKYVQQHPEFFEAAREGTLPSVAWVLPGWDRSEHPPATVSRGQAWVTRVVNAVMESPDWESSAIFVAWDDWGGFYDHVVPPRLDAFSYGLRVPAFMISPYARSGMIDHQVLSFDAYLKFIEDLFMDGARLDPLTDGRWDPRSRVAEDAPQLGDLMDEFDFQQEPLDPIVLPEYPSG
jgi:phospholipase C